MQKQDGINIIIQQKVRTIETPSKKYGPLFCIDYYFKWVQKILSQRELKDITCCSLENSSLKELWKDKQTEAVASVKKVFLKISQNWQENTCVRVSLLIKLQALPFFIEHIWWLLQLIVLSLIAPWQSPFDKKQKHFIKYMHLATGNGLYDQKSFYKVKNYF